MKVELVIWIHSHVDNPGTPHSFEIFSVTGEDVEMAYLDYLKEENEDETEMLFSGLESEYAYRVKLYVDAYEDHYESVILHCEKLDAETRQ